MIETLRLRSFKGFDEIDVPLQPFTLLLGSNGIGKTTILQAVDLLGGLVTDTLPGYLEAQQWEYADLPHLRSRNSKMTLAVDIHFEEADQTLRWEIELGTRRYPGISREKVIRRAEYEEAFMTRDGRRMIRLDERDTELESIEQTLTSSWLSTLEPEEDRFRFPSLLRVAEWARGIRGYFFLDPLKLQAPSRGTRKDVGRHGEHLAAFLATLRDRNKQALQRVIRRVQRHYPPLVNLRPRRSGYGWTYLQVQEKLNGEDILLNARQVSDGLLRMLAASALFELPDRPSVLLLDEIENGLHPHLMAGFMGMLQDLVEESNTQVLVTTHSPISVNYCRSPSSVVVLGRTKRGRTRIKTLDEAKGFDELSRVFDLGEIWYNLGEWSLTR